MKKEHEIFIQDDIYSPEQVAEMLRLEVTTVLKHLNNGQIVGVKKFGRWYILRSDLLEMLAVAKSEKK